MLRNNTKIENIYTSVYYVHFYMPADVLLEQICLCVWEWSDFS